MDVVMARDGKWERVATLSDDTGCEVNPPTEPSIVAWHALRDGNDNPPPDNDRAVLVTVDVAVNGFERVLVTAPARFFHGSWRHYDRLGEAIVGEIVAWAEWPAPLAYAFAKRWTK